MKIRIKPTWRWSCMFPRFGLVVGYENNSQNNWHYHLLYLGLIIVIVSWGNF